MKNKKEAKSTKRKPKTEAEIVQQYANIIISKSRTRGHITESTDSINKNVWMDGDFYFSVVFQSADQKYQFLEQFCRMFKVNIEDYKDSQIQILNGLKLATSLGIALKKEIAIEYQYGDPELIPLVLDNE